MSQRAASQHLHRLDGWLPLRGRWLRYALWTLGAAIAVPAAYVLLVAPALAVAHFLPSDWQLPYALLIAAILSFLVVRTPAATSQPSFLPTVAGMASCCAGVMTAVWVFSLAGTWAEDLRLTCGTARSALTDALLAHVPVALLFAVLSARVSAPSPLVGSLARIAGASAILFWVLALIAMRSRPFWQ